MDGDQSKTKSECQAANSVEKRKRKRKRSCHFDVKEEQQRRNKLLILDKLKDFNKYLGDFGKLNT